MLFQQRERLEEKIVRVLARSPYLTAREISEHLAQLGVKVTQQAIFKELKKLQTQFVVLHVKQRYVLSLAWIESLYSLAEEAEQTQLSPAFLEAIIPGEGKSVKLKFHNLLRMKVFWSQLVIFFLKRGTNKTLYSWNPHPWFYLVQSRHEEQVMHALAANQARMKKIIGGNTVLDKETVRYWDKRFVVYSFRAGPFQEQETLYYSIVENFIIKIELTKAMAHRIDEFYRETRSRTQVDINRMWSLFSAPTTVTLSILHRKLQAERLKRKFEQHF